MHTRAVFLCLVLVGVAYAGRRECLSVKGKVSCSKDRSRASFTHVKLIDENTMARDTVMDQGYTSKAGHFFLYGCSSDTFGDIDPQVRVYHKCTRDGKGQELILKVEQSMIGKEVDVGHLDLLEPSSKWDKKSYSHSVNPPCQE